LTNLWLRCRADQLPLPAGAEAGFTYTLSKETSAILSLLSTATRAEIVDTDYWEKYIVDYAATWYDFARAKGFGEKQAALDSIVLIKSTDKVKSWQHATFRGAKKGASITFGVSAVSTTLAELHGEYTSTQDLSPFSRKTPVERPIGILRPTFDLTPETHDQTIFVQYYKIGIKRSYKERLQRKPKMVTIENGESKTSHLLPKVCIAAVVDPGTY
jgi:hypothetical protein